jgi:hypothetical protein
VMKNFEARWDDYVCENLKTIRQIKDEIESNDLLLPKDWTFRDKILYNFKYNRWLKKVGTIYYTPYYMYLVSHGLAPSLADEK